MSARQLVTGDSTGNGMLMTVSKQYVYVFYFARVDSPLYWEGALIRSTDAGVTWQPRQLLGDINYRGVCSHDSSVYMYFYYVDSGQARGGVLASKDYGNSWNIISQNLPYGNSQGPAQLLMTGSGLHFVYSKGIALGNTGYPEVFYLNSSDFGGTWSMPETLSVNDSITSDEAVIGADQQGNLYVVWRDGKYGSVDGFHATMILRKSTDNGKSWSNEQILSYAPMAIAPTIATNDSDILVGWNEYIDFNHDRTMLRISHGGTTWCDSLSANLGGGDAIVAITNGRIDVCWFVDGQNFYRNGQLSTLDVATNDPIPSEILLKQNYPNPFNPTTKIRYTIPKTQHVSVKIYDLLGRELKTLVDEVKDPGQYQTVWDGANYASGVYFYRLIAGSFVQVKKMLLVK